jgi:hypothetical protein
MYSRHSCPRSATKARRRFHSVQLVLTQRISTGWSASLSPFGGIIPSSVFFRQSRANPIVGFRQHFGQPSRVESLHGGLTMWHECRSMMRRCNIRSVSHDQQGLSTEDNSSFRWVSCAGLVDPLLRRQRWDRWSAPSGLPDNKNLSRQRYAASESIRPTRRDGKRRGRTTDPW